MKRSEAIAIISNFVYELNVDSEDCDAESEKILAALEEAGMKPPENGSNYDSCGSGDDYFALATPRYEWDKE